MRVRPRNIEGYEQLSWLELVPGNEGFYEHDSLSTRIARDDTGAFIVRWATRKEEENDIVEAPEMLHWLACEALANRISSGQLPDVLVIAGVILRAIHLDMELNMTHYIKAAVDYALIERSEKSYIQAVTALREPLLTRTEDAYKSLPSIATQALRLASHTQYPPAIDVYTRLHMEDSFHREKCDPELVLQGLLESLDACVFAKVPYDLACRAFSAFVSNLSKYVPPSDIPDSLQPHRGPDYASVLGTGGVDVSAVPECVQALDLVAA